MATLTSEELEHVKRFRYSFKSNEIFESLHLRLLRARAAVPIPNRSCGRKIMYIFSSIRSIKERASFKFV